MNSKNIPFDFIFDWLPSEAEVKPMFGMWAIYLNEKIMLILRKKEKGPAKNGIWVAMEKQHYESLKKDIPSLCPIDNVAGGMKKSVWQIITENDPAFESSARQVCELIKRGDHRIGKVPHKKRGDLAQKFLYAI